MKIVLLVLVGILLPFMAGLSAITLAIGIAMFLMAIVEWVDEHYANERVRNWLSIGTACCITVVMVGIALYATWAIGVGLLSALWFK